MTYVEELRKKHRARQIRLGLRAGKIKVDIRNRDEPQEIRVHRGRDGIIDLVLRGTASRHRDVLHLQTPHFGQLTMKDVQRGVASWFGIGVKEILSNTRRIRVAYPRQIAMHLCRSMLGRSHPEIGRQFERDPTTVLHAYRKIAALAEESTDVKNTLAKIEEYIKSRPMESQVA